MENDTAVLVGVILLVGLAGCVGGDPRIPNSSSNGSPTAISEFDSLVVDRGGTDGAAIQGGLTYRRAGRVSRYYVTQLTTRQETSRFDESLLGDDARAFVAETEFANESLVVVQVFPASSVPDYRVEELARDGDTLAVGINDSSARATADITVETLLIRIPEGEGGAPSEVTVTTDEGFTFDSSTGIVTRTPEPTDDASTSTTLPYASDDESENVNEPRDVTIRNVGNDTNGYHLVVTATETPACRDETPPCGQPSREVTILERREMLSADGETTIADVISKRGTYRVSVDADVPADDGSRRTVHEEFEWSVSADTGSLEITITDDDVRFGQGS